MTFSPQSSPYRRVYTTAYNSLSTTPFEAELAVASVAFEEASDLITLGNSLIEIRKIRKFVEGKLSVLSNAHDDWQTMIDTMNGNDKKAEAKNRDDYYSDVGNLPQSPSVPKAYNELTSYLSSIILSADNLIDTFDEREQDIRMMMRFKAETTTLQTLPHQSAMNNELPATPPTVSHPLQLTSPLPRLPRIELKKFSGNTWEFHPFWERFSELVHDRQDISDIEKFSFLSSSLEGNAALLIESLPQLGKNYPAAVQMLKSKYMNDNAYTLALQKRIRDTRAESDDPEHQFALLAQIRALVQQLSHTENVEQNKLLVNDVLSKFCFPVVRRTISHFGSNTYSMVQLLDHIELDLNNELYAKQILPADYSMQSHSPSLQSHSHMNQRFKPSVSSSHSVQNTVPPDRNSPFSAKMDCVYCGKHADSSRCRTVPSVIDRSNILRRNGICHVCLKTDHRSESCDKECSRCKAKHHVSVCMKDPKPFASFGTHASIVAENTNTSPTTDSYPVRLMTTPVMISSASTDAFVVCDALLDPGATDTIISDKIVQKLGVKPNLFTRLSFHTLNGTIPAREYPVVELDYIGVGNDFTLTPFTAIVKDDPVFPQLTSSPLPENDMQAVRRYLNSKSVPEEDLSEDSHCHRHMSFHPDIIIGVGDCSRVLGHDFVKLPSGYVMRDTKFGPVVSGGNTRSTEQYIIGHFQGVAACTVAVEQSNQTSVTEYMPTHSEYGDDPPTHTYTTTTSLTLSESTHISLSKAVMRTDEYSNAKEYNGKLIQSVDSSGLDHYYDDLSQTNCVLDTEMIDPYEQYTNHEYRMNRGSYHPFLSLGGMLHIERLEIERTTRGYCESARPK